MIITVTVSLIIKAIIMSTMVLAVTHSLRDSLLVALVSATITGFFVCLSAYMSATITRKQIVGPYVGPMAEKLHQTSESLLTAAETTNELSKEVADTNRMIHEIFDGDSNRN